MRQLLKLYADIWRDYPIVVGIVFGLLLGLLVTPFPPLFAWAIIALVIVGNYFFLEYCRKID